MAQRITQIGQIVNVTPKKHRSTGNTIEVAFPTINGKPPQPADDGAIDQLPRSGEHAAAPPVHGTFTELGVVPPNPPQTTQMHQYGYPGPQPRFNAAENPLVVPYFTIID